MTPAATRGFTLVELLVAMAIALIVIGSMLALVPPVHEAFAVQPEASDVQQRIRVAAAMLTGDIRAAHTIVAGPFGPAAQRPPLLPYRAGPVAGDPVQGRYYRDDAISLVRVVPPVAGSTEPTEVRHTYYLKTDGPIPQLMHYDGIETDLPVLEHIVTLRFEYFGEPAPPDVIPPDATPAGLAVSTYGPMPPQSDEGSARGWPDGENCAWTLVSGTVRSRLATLTPAGPPVLLDPASLADGPWCPDPGHPDRFDLDLVRIRRVRVVLRAQAPPAFRGPQGTLFARGGSGHAVRSVPDQEVRFEVAPRSLNGDR